MKAYITKYALTEGILEFDNAEVNVENPEMLIISDGARMIFFHGKHWHKTRQVAVDEAEIMRLKKISSLNKSIKKFESLKFQ